MKISGIYLRGVAILLIVQIVALMTMFFLVRLGKIRPPFARHAEERTIAIRDLVERELNDVQHISAQKKDDINSLLNTFASSFNGKIWITSHEGEMVASSFSGPVPLTGDEHIDHVEPTPEGDTLTLMERRGHRNMYISGPVRYGGRIYTLHVLNQWQKHREEAWFMHGLLILTIITALLLIPPSLWISRPLERLTAAAKKVSKGDFSPRIKARGRGEISALVNSFNIMAESLERMIRGSRELTANLSHELRSPLARIRISHQIVRERLESGQTDGVDKHIDKMETEIDHMDGLIDKILALSKLDLQEPPAREDIVDVNLLIKDATARQQPTEGRSIILNLNSDLPDFHCHREDMMMVLDNVLTNALKYSPTNCEITVESLKSDDFLEIVVTNPYLPLSDDELETVFVPFKRLGYDSVEGNGLGLAFARKIVEDHRGSMSASSKNNTFRMVIRLPRA